MDIWIGQSDENILNLLTTLKAFGVPDGVDSEFFKENGNAFRMGTPPLSIEIITEATGVDFSASYPNRVSIEADDIEIPFIGYDDLVKNKRASGRLRDLADLEGLGEE
ncbi:MAG TPA: hypothetical protein DCX06_14080 [Opitutae bacterium]|nr:hypothetical protein [Opitutae bacterium]